jgi:hypothetical protein
MQRLSVFFTLVTICWMGQAYAIFVPQDDDADPA